MSIRSWLRKAPQPTALRIVDVDDVTRDIAVTPGRNCWKNAEASILGARAKVVEALNATGTILRTLPIEYEDDPDDVTTSGDDKAAARTASEVDKALAKDRRELGGVLDRYGDRLVEAFKEGAAASNNSHETLVGLVDTLTGHLALAITNLHTISAQYAKKVQEQSSERDPNDDALAGLIAAGLERFSAGQNGGPSTTTRQTNGASSKNGAK